MTTFELKSYKESISYSHGQLRSGVKCVAIFVGYYGMDLSSEAGNGGSGLLFGY